MIKEFIYIIFLFTACGVNNIVINDTRWEYKIGDEIGYFEFDKTEYTNYDAELGEHFYGTYKMKDDQIILYQRKGEYDGQFSEYSRHKTQKDTFKMIIKKKNQLGYKEFWKINAWKDNFYYKKVENN